MPAPQDLGDGGLGAGGGLRLASASTTARGIALLGEGSHPRDSVTTLAPPTMALGIAEASRAPSSGRRRRTTRSSTSAAQAGCCCACANCVWLVIHGTYRVFGVQEDDTGFCTHYACHAARLVFLFSHGAWLLAVASALDRADEVEWFALFTPVWVGDTLCSMLVAMSWVASCPYIALCMEEAPARIAGPPKLLLEVFPEIFLSMVALPCILSAFLGEYSFCAYLDASTHHGDEGAFVSAALFLGAAAAAAVCHGALLTHNSPLFLGMGGSLLLAVLILLFGRPSDPPTQGVAMAPFVFALTWLVMSCVYRLIRYRSVLRMQERVLRTLEVGLLSAMTGAAFFGTRKTYHGGLVEAGDQLRLLGASMCVIAFLRARLCVWEARRGSLEERLIAQVAEPCPNVNFGMALAAEISVARQFTPAAAAPANGGV